MSPFKDGPISELYDSEGIGLLLIGTARNSNVIYLFIKIHGVLYGKAHSSREGEGGGGGLNPFV